MNSRYAIFWTPAPSPLADFGAEWLGWDNATGRKVNQPDTGGLDIAAITDTPRKYGLHATLMAPFRLAKDATEPQLRAALAAFAARGASARAEVLVLSRLKSFLCLRPAGNSAAIDALAAEIVRHFDTFRAPLSETDIARRRASGLDADADARMLRWGYPHVMEGFRFHVTLTGSLRQNDIDAVSAVLAARLDPLLPRPFMLDAISLMGEMEGGRFRVLHRAALAG